MFGWCSAVVSPRSNCSVRCEEPNSIPTVVLAILALQPIYHGEADLTLEWMMLRASLVVNIIFHVLALIAFWKASRLPVRRH